MITKKQAEIGTYISLVLAMGGLALAYQMGAPDKPMSALQLTVFLVPAGVAGIFAMISNWYSARDRRRQ